MACPTDELLAGADAGTLGPEDERRVEAHLAACAGCQGRRARVLEVARAVATLEVPSSADETRRSWEALAAKLRSEKPALAAVSAGAPIEPAMPLDVSRFLDHFELLGELGRGGTGIVYKARHLPTGKTVVLRTILAAESPRARERFAREAALASKLDHPNVVQVVAHGVHRELSYLATEYVEGEDLARLLERGPLELRRALGIVRDMARAAHAAHERGIVHRDLKPSNVLIDRAGHARVIDFGLARPSDGESRLTATGAAIGTPYYMAPEQVMGRYLDIDARSDVWALGAVLYESVMRAHPFEGNTLMELMRKILHEEPASPATRGVPSAVETIILKALAKDRDRRYASAKDLADDIDRFLAGEPIEAKLPPATRIVKAVGEAREASSPAWIAIALALALAVVVGLGFLVLSLVT